MSSSLSEQSKSIRRIASKIWSLYYPRLFLLLGVSEITLKSISSEKRLIKSKPFDKLVPPEKTRRKLGLLTVSKAAIIRIEYQSFSIKELSTPKSTAINFIVSNSIKVLKSYIFTCITYLTLYLCFYSNNSTCRYLCRAPFVICSQIGRWKCFNSKFI